MLADIRRGHAGGPVGVGSVRPWRATARRDSKTNPRILLASHCRNDGKQYPLKPAAAALTARPAAMGRDIPFAWRGYADGPRNRLVGRGAGQLRSFEGGLELAFYGCTARGPIEQTPILRSHKKARDDEKNTTNQSRCGLPSISRHITVHRYGTRGARPKIYMQACSTCRRASIAISALSSPCQFNI
jgi:hypothetical protein